MLDICWSVIGFRSIGLISGEAYDQMAQGPIMHKSLQLLSGNKTVDAYYNVSLLFHQSVVVVFLRWLN